MRGTNPEKARTPNEAPKQECDRWKMSETRRGSRIRRRNGRRTRRNGRKIREKHSRERKERFSAVGNEEIGLEALFYNTRGGKTKLPRTSNCLPVGNVLCRPALFCADRIVFVPMASRWPPLTASGVPTALVRPFEKFVVFIAQESARKCISDVQPASVLTAGRVSSA